MISASDFACNCEPEGRARIAEVTEWAEETLKAKTTDPNFLDRLVFRLDRYRAAITGIHTDQWSVVSARRFGTDDEFSTYIQCDSILDGLMFTLRAFYDKFGEIQ